MAIQNTFYLDVDIKRDNYVDEPKVTQNDAVTFVLRMTDDGVDYPLAGVSTYTLASLRPDNQSVLTVGTLTGVNEITFELGSTEVSVPGNVKAAIQLYDVDGRVSSIPFTYEVTKDIATGYIPSKEEKTLIELVLGQGPAILAAAQTATITANDAATNADAKAALANAEAQDANAAGIYARDKGLLAEQKAALADASANEADTATYNAENATQEAKDATNAINAILPNVEGLENRGEYNSATTYVKNNLVERNGSSWQALQDTQGNSPPTLPTKSNAYWTLISQRGIDGMGAVSTVNGEGPDVNGNVSIMIPDPDLSGLATKAELQTLGDDKVSKGDISINVKDFGAIGDGITDNKVFFQNAIEYTNSLGGGVVYFPPGNYLIGGSINIHSNITISGAGMGATILRLPAGASSSLNTTDGGIWLYADTKSNIKIINLTIDGNGAQQTKTFRSLAFLNSRYITVNDVHFVNSYGTELAFISSSDFMLDKLRFSDTLGAVSNTGVGIYAIASQRGVISNIIANNLGDHFFYTDALSIASSDISCSNIIVTNSGINGIASGSAFNIVGNSQRISLDNCHAYMCASGFRVAEQDLFVPKDVSFNNCTSNVTQKANSGHGFIVNSAQSTPVSIRVSFTNCKAYKSGDGMVGSVSYGFYFANVSDIVMSGVDSIENNEDGAHFLNCKRVQWTGGKLIDNSKGYSSPTRCGVRIGDGDSATGCSDFYISDVLTTDTATSGKLQNLGFFIRAGSSNIIISGGKHTGNANYGWLIDEDVDASCVFLDAASSTGEYRSQHFGTSAPSAGKWRQGDVVWNLNPTATGYIGWSCITSGRPGTWKGFGLIQA